jgi:hypothetical protein
MSDRPCYFPFNLLNLAMPLTTYAVHLVLLIFVLLSSLPCYLYESSAGLPISGGCYNTVRTPTLCKPDMSDRPCYFPFNLLNLAMPLTTYAVRLVLLIFVLLSSLPCYLYDAVLILTLDILYSLIDMFLSILRYISTHVFVVEP